MLVSFSGSVMQSAAILWHVSLLAPPDRKGLALGMVGLVKVIPIAGFSMLSGVVADAVDRRKLMLASQALLALIAVSLGVLTFLGLKVLWPLYLLAALSSSVGTLEGPARQSLVPNLVPRVHLPNAISLNTIMFQASSIIGPSLAGLVIATAGIAWVYVVNAVSYLAIVGALLGIRSPARSAGSPPGTISWAAAREGLRFVFSQPMIRSSMLLDFFATFFASAQALLPIFAQDILRVGPRGYGWLYAAPSIGAVVASVIMVRVIERIDRRGAVLLWAVVAFGLATVAFGVSRIFWVSVVALGVTGAADTVSMVIRNIIRHLETPDAIRGRMTGVNMVFFMGGPQLGELEAGLVAQWLGATFSVVSGGIGCLVATAWIAVATPALREYRRIRG
jgi:MFS family permease